MDGNGSREAVKALLELASSITLGERWPRQTPLYRLLGGHQEERERGAVQWRWARRGRKAGTLQVDFQFKKLADYPFDTTSQSIRR